MSLAVVILIDAGSIVFTDSRSLTSDFSASKSGVQKFAMLTLKWGEAVVAFTGDGEINGMLTLDILTESAKRSTNAGDLPEALLGGLRSAFRDDVANFPWESEGDKDTYIREAKVVLHILTAPKTHKLWRVTPQRTEEIPFPAGANEAFSGVGKVECFTGIYRPWDLNLVRAHLLPCIHRICTNERSCGYPVDVTVWKSGSAPQTKRCADLEAINVHLASLAKQAHQVNRRRSLR